MVSFGSSKGGKPVDEGASSSQAHHPTSGRPALRSALDPIASDSRPSSIAVLGEAVKTLGNSWVGRGGSSGGGGELLADGAHPVPLVCLSRSPTSGGLEKLCTIALKPPTYLSIVNGSGTDAFHAPTHSDGHHLAVKPAHRLLLRSRSRSWSTGPDAIPRRTRPEDNLDIAQHPRGCSRAPQRPHPRRKPVFVRLRQPAARIPSDRPERQHGQGTSSQSPRNAG